MTLLDKLIAYVDPQRAARRVFARSAIDRIQRFGYDGAKKGRRAGGWMSPSSDANAELGPAIADLRNRARDLVRNNPYAAKALSDLVGNQIGTGIMPRANTGDKKLDAKIDAEFKVWCEECDADGQLDFFGVQMQVARAVPESGESLVRFRPRRPKDGLRVPLQLQVLESDFLDSSRTFSLNSGGYIINGVQFNAIGQREGYWMFPQHPGAAVLMNPQGIVSKFIPASEVLHVYRKDRPGQVRGATWFAPVMLKMHDLDEYEDAELIRKKIEACLAAFVTQNGGADGITLGNVRADTSNPARRVESFEPGMVAYLDPGQDVKFNTPGSTNGYRDYRTTQLQSIAAGLGMPYEMLSGDMGLVNYSSFRGGMLGFRSMIEAYRWLCLMPMFLTPIWRRFIDTAVLAGVIPTANYGVKWTAPKFESVDPYKDAMAERQRIRNGTQPLPEAIAERGLDPDSTLQEYAETNKKLDDLELVFDTDPRKVNDKGQSQQAQSQQQAA